MMGADVGLAVLAMLACGLFLPILLGGGYLVLRSGRRAPAGDARDVLDQRLARGEIGTDEYLEVDSALRSGGPSGRRGR